MRKIIRYIICLIIISCANIKKDETNKAVIDCFLGRMTVSEYPKSNSFWLFVSAIMINNTNDTIFMPSVENDLKGFHSMCPSHIYGCMKSDTVHFERLITSQTIAPNDTERLLLVKRFYKPNIPDSMFFSEYKSIQFKYMLKKTTTPKGKILDSITFHKNEHSKFIIGKIEERFGYKRVQKGVPLDY